MTLQDRINELEAAIRKHRDQKGDDRCWLDDQELYKVLGDTEANFTLPDRETFLTNCAKYHECRQPPGIPPLINPAKGRWISLEELERKGIK